MANRLMPALIVDANVVISALLGRSLPLMVATTSRGIELLVPVTQWIEIRSVLAHLRPDRAGALMELVEDIVDILPIEAFVAYEDRARDRLEEGGQSDWPVLAAAMALEIGIWSKDSDFLGVGVPIWATRNIKHYEGEMT
jgi:predicted nucleic acid-binding protein